MSDVAKVEDGPDQPKAYAWFGSKDGEFPAVTLQIIEATRRQCRRCGKCCGQPHKST
jgi:multidrug efflux pump subunit AcrB